jgi:hypothetical protein
MVTFHTALRFIESALMLKAQNRVDLDLCVPRGNREKF